MLVVPNCWKRKCKHYIGIRQKDGTEATERPVCNAFPEEIPEEIAYGDNPHTEPHPGDHGIQYEAG